MRQVSPASRADSLRLASSAGARSQRARLSSRPTPDAPTRPIAGAPARGRQAVTLARRFDTIVIGVGGMGSAAVYQLARRGRRVLGLERFDIPHSMGSSHGVNRIIRLAYYEHPSYVPLLKRAFQNWRSLESECGEQLLIVTGSIDVGPEDNFVFRESKRSC